VVDLEIPNEGGLEVEMLKAETPKGVEGWGLWRGYSPSQPLQRDKMVKNYFWVT